MFFKIKNADSAGKDDRKVQLPGLNSSLVVQSHGCVSGLHLLIKS